MYIRTTHIDFVKEQLKDLPFDAQILSVKTENKALKISFIENPKQSGISQFEFRMYTEQDIVDFNHTAYTYLGSHEYEQVDYYVFAKMIGQLNDL